MSTPAPRVGAMPGSASERRDSARTAVVWEALGIAVLDQPGLDVLDIGGGTGGFAVRVAGLGHRVTVVDPSPDALAALARRAREDGVEVAGQQGDLGSLLELAGPAGADVVLCHGVLEVVDDPAAALATIREVLRPGGRLSLLVAQRHAAVIARAMAGHVAQALALLDDPSANGPHRPHGQGSPPTSSPGCSPTPASRSARCTASGSSPTWSPAPSSTSSPAPPPRCSSWSARSRTAPSTSRWRHSCTCLPRAEKLRWHPR